MKINKLIAFESFGIEMTKIEHAKIRAFVFIFFVNDNSLHETQKTRTIKKEKKRNNMNINYSVNLLNFNEFYFKISVLIKHPCLLQYL